MAKKPPKKLAEFTPEDIDFDPILLIHRGKESAYIGLARKPNRVILDKHGKPINLQHLFSFSVKDVKSYLPQVRPFLMFDSYFTVNSFYRQSFWKNRITGLPDVERKEESLSYFNACYVDLDFGRPKSKVPEKRLLFTEAMTIVSVLAETGEIPPPSIIARSGRGAYLLWLLHDPEKPTEPERAIYQDPFAFARQIELYKQVNKAIGEKLLPVAWDKTAFDAARVLRISGSYHSKAERFVGFQVQFDEEGKFITYSMGALAERMKVPVMEVDLPGNIKKLISTIESPGYKKTPAEKKGTAPYKIAAMKGLNIKRVRDLLLLEQKVGGFEEGHRRRRLTVYAEFLRRYTSKGSCLKSLKTMAGNCKPPYPSEKDDPSLESIVDFIYSGKKGSVRSWNNEKLCIELGITAEMAEDFITIVPAEIKEKREQLPTKTARDKETRHEAIIEILKNTYDASAREIARILKREEIKGGLTIVSRELPQIRAEIQKSRLENSEESKE